MPIHRSIRLRLTLLVVVLIITTVMSISGFMAWKGFEREVASQQSLLAGAASAYAAAIADPVAGNDKAAAVSMLRGVRDLPGIVQADITLANGRVFAQLGSGAILVGRDDARALTARDLFSSRQMHVEIPILNGGEQVGTLGMLADISTLREAVFDSLRATAIMSLVAIIAGIALAQWPITHLTRPLRQLTAMMAAFRDDEAASIERIEGGRDETGVLAETFNTMIGSIVERDARLARHLASLEQTVEERTHSLRIARDEAEAANAAKSNFLATMSHEIRTPMNGMMVMAEMLTSADLSPRHRRYADIISRSGKSLLTIINDILDLSKIESGKMDLEILPVSLDSLVADVASLFWERAREKGLQLATYVSPHVPVSILGDPTRLNQIVTNLVNNALKFTESGGVTIRVDARPCPDTESVTIIINVEDSGIGIAEDKIGAVFEAFSQADQSTTRKYGGTGLGLSICSRLADAMGGTIAVESEPGRGSVFRLEVALPVDQAAPALPWVGLSAMVSVGAGQAQDTLERSLRDFGCTIVSGDADFMIGTSATLQAEKTPAGVPCIILSDIGDTMADALLRDGTAVDALANPVSRAELSDLLARAATGDYLGTAVRESRASHADTPSFDGKSILAVDDNPVNREVLREALGALRIAVTFAVNGREAVEKAAAGSFDIILMDGSMPVMGGIEATQLIRAHETKTRSPRTRLLALTAQVSGDDASTWRSAGADGYLTKPFTMERLVAALSDADSPEPAMQASQPGPSDVTGELLAMDTLASMDALGSQSGRNVRQRIWTMFHAEAPRACTGLATLINSGATNPEIVRQAHALRSMALSAGAKQVAQICESLERDAGVGLPRDVLAETVASLASALEATYDAMGFHTDGEEPARSAS